MTGHAAWVTVLAAAVAVAGPATPVVRQDSVVARGRYLANGIARCFWCHSPLDDGDPAVPRPERLGSGDVLDEKAPVNAPNLTPDEETGLGRWPDRDIVRAIRESLGRDGRPLRDHPGHYYSVMTDEDARAIVAYLRTLRPIRRSLPRSAPATDHHESVQAAVLPARAETLSSPTRRGAYLVQLGECMGCHTPRQRAGEPPLREWAFAGGRLFRIEKGAGSETTDLESSSTPPAGASASNPIVASANITPDPSGIPYYDADVFIQTIRTGKVAGVRPLSAAMPWVFFRTMTDADLRDIFAYLQTVRPVRHRVSNSEPATLCPLCGRRHGLGEQNGRPSAAPP